MHDSSNAADAAPAATSAGPAPSDYLQLPAWSWRDTGNGEGNGNGDSNGVTIRGRHRAAAPGAPSVHWLSGNSFSGGIYWPFLAQLPSAWGLMTHDMEGHGESDPAQRFAGVEETLRRVRGTLAQRTLPAPRIAIGHSFGAALSMRFATRNPGAFDALVLLDPIILPPMYWVGTKAMSLVRRHPVAQPARRRRSVWPDRDATRAHLAGRGIYEGWDERCMDAFIAHGTHDTPRGRELVCHPELEAQIFENPLWGWRDIRNVSVPTLLLYGDRTYGFMAGAVARLASMQPRVHLQSLPGAHCFMLEQPEATAAAIREWVQGQKPSVRGTKA